MYALAVQGFDWSDFYARFAGEAYFEWLRRSLIDDELADVVLVDSRTGVTEMAGVCPRQRTRFQMQVRTPVAYRGPACRNIESNVPGPPHLFGRCDSWPPTRPLIPPTPSE